jgi:hypothetical protein
LEGASSDEEGDRVTLEGEPFEEEGVRVTLEGEPSDPSVMFVASEGLPSSPEGAPVTSEGAPSPTTGYRVGLEGEPSDPSVMFVASEGLPSGPEGAPVTSEGAPCSGMAPQIDGMMSIFSEIGPPPELLLSEGDEEASPPGNAARCTSGIAPQKGDNVMATKSTLSGEQRRAEGNPVARVEVDRSNL